MRPHPDSIANQQGRGGSGEISKRSGSDNIYIRKGVLSAAVYVGGGQRDHALYADARRRVIEIAKLVAARLP